MSLGIFENYETCRTVLFKEFQKIFSCFNQLKFYLLNNVVKVGGFEDEAVSFQEVHPFGLPPGLHPGLTRRVAFTPPLDCQLNWTLLRLWSLAIVCYL